MEPCYSVDSKTIRTFVNRDIWIFQSGHLGKCPDFRVEKDTDMVLGYPAFRGVLISGFD